MATELVTMSTRELECLEIIRRIQERRLTQAKAGQLLGLLSAITKKRGILDVQPAHS